MLPYQEANKDLLAGSVTPAEGESTVRTYHCTYYREKSLGLKEGGFLGITNKRVIFQAAGETKAGRSVIQSEVPIADVSGINSFKGNYFNIFAFLGALILAAMAITLVPLILTGISYALESYTFFKVLSWLIALGGLIGSFFVSIKTIWRTFLVGVSAGALLALAGGGILDTFIGFGGGGGDIWIQLLILITLIYLLVCAAWYARKPTFSLDISSSGGSSTPIHIASVGGFMNMSTIPNALPGEDSEKMLHEIGALITDIQTLGDYGIAKWKN